MITGGLNLQNSPSKIGIKDGSNEFDNSLF
jgi:hypothetical protein